MFSFNLQKYELDMLVLLWMGSYPQLGETIGIIAGHFIKNRGI
jgi:hypothetical protein